MKKRLLGIIALSILSIGFATLAYANQPIKLILNNQPLETDVAPQLIQGKVLVPIRVISEALGVDILWKSEEKAVVINGETSKASDLQVSLLEQALAPTDPLSAAKTWAEGIKKRNGALQYAVMSPELRKEKYEELSQNNWSTGTSSPWVESYEISEKAAEDESYKYEITFTYTDSTKSTYEESQLVTVHKVDNNWVISNIDTVHVTGTITELYSSGEEVTGIFVENPQAEKGSYDKAKLSITSETKIYKGYTSRQLTAKDLKKGMKIEATFNGPVLMIYPVQGGAKEIRIIEGYEE